MKKQNSIIFILTFCMLLSACTKTKKEDAQEDKIITVITDENDKVVQIISDIDEPQDVVVDNNKTKGTKTARLPQPPSPVAKEEQKETDTQVTEFVEIRTPEEEMPTPNSELPSEESPEENNFVLKPAEEFVFEEIAIEYLELKEGRSNLSIGFSFAPEYAYRTTKTTDVVGKSLLPASEDETAKFGFTAGLSLDYRITNWLSFETGMLFSNKGYALNKNEIKSYSIYYLEVPLMSKFYFAEWQGIRYYASGGVVPAFYLSSKIKSANKDLNNTSIYPAGSTKFNKLNFAGALGLGAQYEFNTHLFLNVEAAYKHAFSPMDDLALQRKLYSFGLDFTLYYRL